MRIVVDLQGFQQQTIALPASENILSFIKTLVHYPAQHDVVIVLDGAITETIEPIRVLFADIIREENIAIWYSTPLDATEQMISPWQHHAAQLIKKSFLARLNADIICVAGIEYAQLYNFSQNLDYLPPQSPTVVLINESPKETVQSDFSLSLLQSTAFNRIDLFLTYSETTRQNILTDTNIAADKVISFDLPDLNTAAQNELLINQAELVAIAWNQAILKTLDSFSRLTNSCRPLFAVSPQKPRLAFVSPLPPERSGIADYSAELLPVLANYYEIDVIVEQQSIDNDWIIQHCAIHDSAWLIEHQHKYTRVLYHFGNSAFHVHMFELLKHVPGIVVLHDFFLAHAIAHIELASIQAHFWTQALYQSHGYPSVVERLNSQNLNVEVFKYPCSKNVIESALGVIIHSRVSQTMALDWYDLQWPEHWRVIPLLRVSVKLQNKLRLRQTLGLPSDAFIVSSFGALGESKQNQRLLESWLNSSLSRDPRCLLIFVGERHDNAYCDHLADTIQKSGYANQIIITGWMEAKTFSRYLGASDLGVQLRTLSRGETSAAVLDCMNYGLATIVNANGSMAELPADTVWMLPDEFDDTQLITALETLWQYPERRTALALQAKQAIEHIYKPEACAEQYAEAIEYFYQHSNNNQAQLIHAIADIMPSTIDNDTLIQEAQHLALHYPPVGKKQLFIDVSALVEFDLKTGIQRVVRSILNQLLVNPPPGFRVEPVYARADGNGYYYARKFTLAFLECPTASLADDPIEFAAQDIFLGLDLHQHVVIHQLAFYQQLRNAGVKVYFVVYDLLPILFPQFFPDGSKRQHEAWLEAVSQTDGALCISKAVADETMDWLMANNIRRHRPFYLGWFHLGADISESDPTRGLPDNAAQQLAYFESHPSFLLVGTIEPRKGYLQVIDEFERLWDADVDVNLVIVGREGWKGLPDEQRRTIPAIIKRIMDHAELNQRLFWINEASDEYLEKIYNAAGCLIAASEGEGFGLPLIEAAQNGLAIIARDIPVFKEVAGQYAYYFSGEPGSLALSIQKWLMLKQINQIPLSTQMPWLTWKQSAHNIQDILLQGSWYQTWVPKL